VKLANLKAAVILMSQNRIVSRNSNLLWNPKLKIRVLVGVVAVAKARVI
jgi:uncharacterized membrane protein